MKTWLTDYRTRFESAVHGLLWRQWTMLGVAGTGPAGSSSAPVDPEALLLLTLESARTEPRLFDEVLDWLLLHGHAIDVQRLRNLQGEDSESPGRLMSAVAAFVGEKDASSKWKRLAAPPRKPPRQMEALFLLPGTPGLADSSAINSLFTKYGYRRHPIRPRGLTGPIPKRLAASLRFQLRALFGLGIRAEALTYLVSGRSGHVKEISTVAGYSTLGTHQALGELAGSEVVQVKTKGNRKIYWTDAIRWWGFLGIEKRLSPGRLVSTSDGLAFQDADVRTSRDAEGRVTGWSQGPLVSWVDWRSYFLGLAHVLRFLRRQDLAEFSTYAGESELRRVIQEAEASLVAAGSPYRPTAADATPRDHGERLLASIKPAEGPGS